MVQAFGSNADPTILDLAVFGAFEDTAARQIG